MKKLFKPYVSFSSYVNVCRVLFSGQLAEGTWVKRFEEEFADKCEFQRNRVVALNSGTSALELAYELAGIKKGDEVIVPVLTCVATNMPLLRRGAKIVFADINYDLNINPDDIRKKITKRTKAIVFVHFGGNNGGIEEVLDIAEKHKLILIEDAAQAVGSERWGLGDYTAVSLQAIKTITAGDGGVLICNTDEDAKKARRLRWFGYDREAKQRDGDGELFGAGYKYHMNNISAAIALGNMKHFDKLVAHRKMLRDFYKDFGLVGGIWFCAGFSREREKLFKYMAMRGVELGIHHFRNDKYEIFGGRKKGLKMMDALENKYFLLPLHHGVSYGDAKGIVRKLLDFKKCT